MFACCLCLRLWFGLVLICLGLCSFGVIIVLSCLMFVFVLGLGVRCALDFAGCVGGS